MRNFKGIYNYVRIHIQSHNIASVSQNFLHDKNACDTYVLQYFYVRN